MNGTMRAAFVIARRDFTALVWSRSFLFFLIGPLVMLGIALAAGGLGSQVARESGAPVIGTMLPGGDTARLLAARDRLQAVASGLPGIEPIAGHPDPAALLRDGRGGKGYAAILTGTLDRPILFTTPGNAGGGTREVQFLLGVARDPRPFERIAIDARIVPAAVAPAQPDRLLTAQLSQMALFLLTMLLAGMVLSNLVEEKTNKIIEILAASTPIEAIFLGKLFAMLAMAWVGIGVWVGAGALILSLKGGLLIALPAPAIGWPLFLLLAILYFSTAYLLLGSLFLSIGAMAGTVREVQTLSMPVTMGHLGIFLFATYGLTRLGQPVEIAAAILPFSSPFAMLARAAQQSALWPQLLALAWQALCTWLIVRAGSTLFRRNVLKSAGGGRKRRRSRLPRPA